MGVYDEVYAVCANCGERVYFQSKAGDCSMGSYSPDDVPIAIAADLDGDSQGCTNCEATVLIETIPEPIKTIRMQATTIIKRGRLT